MTVVNTDLNYLEYNYQALPYLTTYRLGAQGQQANLVIEDTAPQGQQINFIINSEVSQGQQ